MERLSGDQPPVLDPFNRGGVGGQALERWPRELFVSAELATRTLNYFFQFGKQDPALEWIRIDGFPREILWEGRDQREAWERANPRNG